MNVTIAKAAPGAANIESGGECKKVGSFLRSQCITAESRLSTAKYI